MIQQTLAEVSREERLGAEVIWDCNCTLIVDVVEYLYCDVSTVPVRTISIRGLHSRSFIIPTNCQEEQRYELETVVQHIIDCRRIDQQGSQASDESTIGGFDRSHGPLFCSSGLPCSSRIQFSR